MDDLKQQILDGIKNSGEYQFSNDAAVKTKELTVINDLESQNIITVKARTIGYCICEIV